MPADGAEGVAPKRLPPVGADGVAPNILPPVLVDEVAPNKLPPDGVDELAVLPNENPPVLPVCAGALPKRDGVDDELLVAAGGPKLKEGKGFDILWAQFKTGLY